MLLLLMMMIAKIHVQAMHLHQPMSLYSC